MGLWIALLFPALRAENASQDGSCCNFCPNSRNGLLGIYSYFLLAVLVHFVDDVTGSGANGGADGSSAGDATAGQDGSYGSDRRSRRAARNHALLRVIHACAGGKGKEAGCGGDELGGFVHGESS